MYLLAFTFVCFFCIFHSSNEKVDTRRETFTITCSCYMASSAVEIITYLSTQINIWYFVKHVVDKAQAVLQLD